MRRSEGPGATGMAVLLTGCLLIGCASRSEGSGVAAPAATATDAAHTGAVPDATSSTHRLAFVASIESSCSESWGYDTYKGELVLSIDGHGHAIADLAIRGRSVGPGHEGQSYASDSQHACQWSGAVAQEGKALVLSLSATTTDPGAPYVCAIEDHAPGARRTDFQLRCSPVPRGAWPEQSLACTPVTPAPWFLELLRTGDVIPLGGADLTVEVHRGGLSDRAPILRGAPRP